MADYGTDNQYDLRHLLGSSLINEIDEGFKTLATDVANTFAGYSEGTLANRPTSTLESPGIAGRLFRASDTGEVFMDTGSGWTRLGDGPGDMKATARSTAPDGWLLCDGAAVSRSTYAALFAAIGTAYGAGDGSTTFNLPNSKGKVFAGRDTAQTEFNTLGKAGGAKTHALTLAEIPLHDHDVPGGWNVSQVAAGSAAFGLNSPPGGEGQIELSAARGGGGAHNNLQPYQVTNWIIKI